MWRASVDRTLDRLCSVDLTGASGRPEQCPVKGYNGSIFVGAINRRGVSAMAKEEHLGGLCVHA